MAEAKHGRHLDFIAYIVEKSVLEGKVEREKIVRRAANYVVIGTELYRHSVVSRCANEVHPPV
jgi:hypothetical protein